MKPTEQLILAASKLASGAGKNWDEFLSALHLYRDDYLTLMAQAPPDKVHVMQGHARAAIDLCTHFDNCREKARQIEERKTNA